MISCELQIFLAFAHSLVSHGIVKPSDESFLINPKWDLTSFHCNLPTICGFVSDSSSISAWPHFPLCLLLSSLNWFFDLLELDRYFFTFIQLIIFLYGLGIQLFIVEDSTLIERLWWQTILLLQCLLEFLQLGSLLRWLFLQSLNFIEHVFDLSSLDFTLHFKLLLNSLERLELALEIAIFPISYKQCFLLYF